MPKGTETETETETKISKFGTRTNPVPQFREVLQGFVATSTLCRLFGKSKITIHLWKTNKGLPFVEVPLDERRAIVYDLNKVKAWAKKNRIKTYPIALPENNR